MHIVQEESEPSGNSVLSKLATVTVAVAAVALCGVAVVEGWQVIARYVLNASPSWTEPVALLLMSTTMMFGAAAGVRAEAHFGFFIAADAAAPQIKLVLHIFARIVVAVIGLMLFGQGGFLMIDAWVFDMAGMPLPQGLVFLPMCVGGALIAVFSLERIWLEGRAWRGA